MSVSPVQLWNAAPPRLVTLFGIVTLVKLMHSSNACIPISVTLPGIFTLVRLLQLANALPPMLVTLSGISYDVSVLPDGYLISDVFSLLKRTPSTELYRELSPSMLMFFKAVSPVDAISSIPLVIEQFFNVMVSKPVQLSNAPLPMLVTLSGIVTFVSPLHHENALLPMFVTLFGIVTLAKLVQPENA